MKKINVVLIIVAVLVAFNGFLIYQNFATQKKLDNLSQQVHDVSTDVQNNGKDAKRRFDNIDREVRSVCSALQEC